MKREDRKP